MSSRVVSFMAFLTIGLAGIAVACGVGIAQASAPAATNPPIVTAPHGADPLMAWQRFAACMSKHSGNRVQVMPPPSYGVRIVGASNPNTTATQQAAFEARTRAANAVCHHYLAAIQKSSTSSKDEARFRDQALAFARC